MEFLVAPTPLTAFNSKKISEIIAHYKATEKKWCSQKYLPKLVE
jgi:hypothetical protein